MITQPRHDDRLAQALRLHHNGELDRAEQLYRQILTSDPRDANALNLLGTIARQRGDYSRALELTSRATTLCPQSALFLLSRGDCLRLLHRYEEALLAYDDAREQCDWPQIYRAMGQTYMRLGRLREAELAFREGLRRNPDGINNYEYLVDVLLCRGCVADAEPLCQTAIRLAPTNVSLQMSWARIMLSQRRWHAAAEAFAYVACRLPDCAEAISGLSLALNHMRRFAQAERAARHALSKSSHDPRAHLQLGIAVLQRGQLTLAAAEFSRVIELQPRSADAHALLAACELNRLRQVEAVRLYEVAAQLSPGSRRIGSSHLLAQNYPDGVSHAALHESHKQWALTARGARASLPPDNRKARGDKVLRIGYVSPDLRTHSVARFIECIFQKHNRSVCTPVAFSDVEEPDTTTGRLKAFADEWHTTAALSDDEFRSVVDECDIDILVDLAGHTANNRLGAFAVGLAPVQLTYLGYPNTTGLPDTLMYGRITDGLCDPPGMTEHLFTERLIRLPRSFLCFRPPHDEPPAVARPPSAEPGVVTFGCFNAIAKITPRVMTAWGEILRRVPKARVLLKNGSTRDAAVRKRLADCMTEQGIASERVVIVEPERSVGDHLACYGAVDISLDTFPYHGTTTTCEALWMGVPVITIAGDCHRSRVGVSILTNMGMEALIARNYDEYIERSVALAVDSDARCLWRRGLRERMRGSALMDESGFIAELEHAYKTAWNAVVGTV